MFHTTAYLGDIEKIKRTLESLKTF